MILDIWRNTQMIEDYNLNLYDNGRQAFLYNLVSNPTLLENVKLAQSNGLEINKV